MRLSLVLATVALVAAACSGSGATPAIDVEAAPAQEAELPNPEVATALATGAMFVVYDEPDANPVTLRTTVDSAELEGQTVLDYDILVEVTIDGERAERRWRVLVGTAADGNPAVLRATEQ